MASATHRRELSFEFRLSSFTFRISRFRSQRLGGAQGAAPRPTIVVEAVSHRVKRRRGGSMVPRWAALGLTQAERGFRRVKGAKKGMSKLTAALRENDARPEAAAAKPEKPREVA